jgi:hypothetical protein
MASFNDTPEPPPPPPPPPEERKRRRRAIARWWFAGAGLAVVLIAVLLLGGGDDDDGGAPTDADASPDPTAGATTASAATGGTSEAAATSDAEVPPAIEGIWEFIVDVTEAHGVCEGEDAEEPSIDNVTIRRVDDGAYVVTGLGSGPDDEWEGGWDGDRFVFHGDRDEDDGVTVAEFSMAFDESGALTGVEQWTWSDDDSECPDGRSDVEAYFNGPLG